MLRSILIYFPFVDFTSRTATETMKALSLCLLLSFPNSHGNLIQWRPPVFGADLSLNRQLMIHIILFGSEFFASCHSIWAGIWLDEGKEPEEGKMMKNIFRYFSLHSITCSLMRILLEHHTAVVTRFPSSIVKLIINKTLERKEKAKRFEERFEKLIRIFSSIFFL